MRSEEFYDHLSSNYSSLNGVSEHYLTAVNRAAASYIDGARSWLDVGTGDGLRAASILDSLHQRPHSVTLCDSSSGMIETARQNLPAEHVVRWRLEDGPPFPTHQTFQVITLLGNVLGHIHPQTARLQQLSTLHQLLDDDGTILLDFNNRWNARAYGIDRAALNIISDLLNRPRTTFIATKSINGQTISTSVYIGSPHEYKTLIKRAGFHINGVVYHNYTSGKIGGPLTGQGFIKAAKRRDRENIHRRTLRLQN